MGFFECCPPELWKLAGGGVCRKSRTYVKDTNLLMLFSARLASCVACLVWQDAESQFFLGHSGIASGTHDCHQGLKVLHIFFRLYP